MSCQPCPVLILAYFHLLMSTTAEADGTSCESFAGIWSETKAFGHNLMMDVMVELH